MIAKFDWAEAKTVQQALSQLGEGAVVKAGGIDLIDRLKEGLDEPKRLVNIRNVAEMSGISSTPQGLRLGPLATLTEVADSQPVRRQFTALADACGHAATPNIRNMATVGGNLLQRPRCWYFRSEQFHCLKKGGERCFAQDGENDYHAIFGNKVCAIVHPSAAAMALVALGASIELTSARGKRTLALEKFFVRPEEDVTRENSLAADELLTSITIPSLAAGARSAYMKLGEKESFDWPIAEVAVVTGSRPAVILGAAAPYPYRATEAEQMLAGKTIDAALAAAAARVALRGATPLRNNGYKLPVFEAVIRRTILAAAQGAA